MVKLIVQLMIKLARPWVVRTTFINASLECALANVTPGFLQVLCFLELGNQHNDYKRCNSSVIFVFRVCNDFTITAPSLMQPCLL